MIKMVLFDKDGTLLRLGDLWQQPSVDIVEKILQESDLPETEYPIVREALGVKDGQLQINSVISSGSIWEQAVLLSRYLNQSPESLNNQIEDYYYHYIEQSSLDHILVEGVPDMLADLKTRYLLGLITNDNRSITHLTMARLGILDDFDFIGCADEYGAKPNPAALHEVAKRFNIRLDEMVYVGDSVVDIDYGKFTARAIGYAQDAATHAVLSATPADIIMDDFSQLAPYLNSLDNEEDHE